MELAEEIINSQIERYVEASKAVIALTKNLFYLARLLNKKNILTLHTIKRHGHSHGLTK